MELDKNQQLVYVTEPLIPKLKDFIPYLEQIWDNKILTNGGPFHEKLEQALCEHLGVSHISLFTNGTIALITALQALRIQGEVITTPFSFVATAHSLMWNGVKPIFVDIDPITLNLDPKKIEAAITPQTSAIMPVHCYGRPCDVEKIQRIADNYGLRVIYDAAHAFGVEDRLGSILRHGDLSILSFHATKVFNTFEGGAIISNSLKAKQHIDHLKNFGIVDEVSVVAAGINGKMNEISAAFGLLQLKEIEQALEKRSLIARRYRAAFADIQGISCLEVYKEGRENYAYFPIFIDDSFACTRDELYEKLLQQNIKTRRYFFPLITDFPMYRGMPSAASSNLPIAKEKSTQVLCLPIYPTLAENDQERVIQCIRHIGRI